MSDQNLHRFYVSIATTKQWYLVMHECRAWFGSQWKSQPRVKRKLEKVYGQPLIIWFDVPDPRWATWISTKYALEISSKNKDTPNK